MTIKLKYKKACECKGTSSINKFLQHPQAIDENLTKIAFTLTPTPVCDVCHTLWVEDKEVEFFDKEGKKVEVPDYL